MRAQPLPSSPAHLFSALADLLLDKMGGSSGVVSPSEGRGHVSGPPPSPPSHALMYSGSYMDCS